MATKGEKLVRRIMVLYLVLYSLLAVELEKNVIVKNQTVDFAVLLGL